MSATHTPGPWFAHGRYIGTANHKSLIGECRDVSGNWSDAEPASANARLIAAAPDLLDTAVPALVELDVVIGLLTSERTRAEMQVVADNLRAAIAKATGA